MGTLLTSNGVYTRGEIFTGSLHVATYDDDQSCAGTNPTPTHFTGKLRDPETGLDYSQARYYSSNAGRWMLPDWSAVPQPVPYADLGNLAAPNPSVGGDPVRICWRLESGSKSAADDCAKSAV
ncbi:MAG: RHS repeat-associated core domain-containing protein [Acidobacteriaceae bacterium]